jgi:hypothetical protein
MNLWLINSFVGNRFFYIVYIIHWQVRQIGFAVSIIILSTWYENVLMEMFWPVDNVANSCFEGPGFDSCKTWDMRFLCSDQNNGIRRIVNPFQGSGPALCHHSVVASLEYASQLIQLQNKFLNLTR